MNDTINPNNSQHDDPGLKELILKAREYGIALWKGKILILVLAVLFGSIFFLRARLTHPTYGATLTFALNEGESGGVGGVGGLLGQFGLGSSSTGKVSLDKIVELSKSMRIVNQALFEKATVAGKEDYLANHILLIYELNKKWAKNNPPFEHFRFTHDSFPAFTLEENSALKGIYGFTVGGMKPGLVTCGYNTESTIFSMTSTTENEELSLALTENIFHHLSRFYIQQSSDKQKQTYDLVKAKTDSIYRQWTSSEFTASNMEESEGALWAPSDRTRRTIKVKQSNMYAMAYGEAIKNLEMADYAVKNSTPFIREIDRPFSPLYPQSPAKLRQIIMGLILGSFIAAGWLLGRKIILDAINS